MVYEDNNDNNDEDPFDVFGVENDVDDAEVHTTESEENTSVVPSLRDPTCGVMVFHEGTEQSLLHYVRNELEATNKSTSSSGTKSPLEKVVQRCDCILRLIDNFCMARHWMMHVGHKGEIVRDFLLEENDATLLNRQKQQQQQQPSSHLPYIIVELGTYCGYSLILMARAMLGRAAIAESSEKNESFHIFSVDINPQNQQIAREMIQLAGLDEYATFLLLQQDPDPTFSSNELTKTLRTAISCRFPNNCSPPLSIDFLFIDHAKELYLSDLLQLEESAFIRCGTRVCADNVVFFQLDKYRDHMQQLAARGIAETRLETSNLEYTNQSCCREGFKGDELQDGLELTVYKKDPF